MGITSAPPGESQQNIVVIRICKGAQSSKKSKLLGSSFWYDLLAWNRLEAHVIVDKACHTIEPSIFELVKV